MGMRTIRWRNGQCPGRNGQWAERIAHAGSEAVRLVPFSSLPAVILDYLLSEYLVSAWRLPLCRDAVRITISIELVANFCLPAVIPAIWHGTYRGREANPPRHRSRGRRCHGSWHRGKAC